MQDLVNEIIEDLTEDLQNEPDFSSASLAIKVKNAVKAVKAARKYPKSYTKQMIDDDLQNYYDVIKDLSLYDYNMIGVEGQNLHIENGIHRGWVNRKEIFNGVLPLATL